MSCVPLYEAIASASTQCCVVLPFRVILDGLPAIYNFSSPFNLMIIFHSIIVRWDVTVQYRHYCIIYQLMHLVTANLAYVQMLFSDTSIWQTYVMFIMGDIYIISVHNLIFLLMVIHCINLYSFISVPRNKLESF